MSEFRAGQYVIRYHVIPGHDVATAQCEQPDPPVVLKPLSTGLLPSQNWVAKPAKDGEWIIELWSEVAAVSRRLSIRDPSRPPEGPVITTDVPILKDGASLKREQFWTLSPVKNDGANDTYILRPATDMVGVDYCVGVEKGELYIRTFDIRDPTPRPSFEFIKIAD